MGRLFEVRVEAQIGVFELTIVGRRHVWTGRQEARRPKTEGGEGKGRGVDSRKKVYRTDRKNSAVDARPTGV